MKNKFKTEYVSFKVYGENFTNHVRGVWDSDMPGTAIRTVTEGLVGTNIEIALDICEGRKKLVGCNDLDLIDDNCKRKCDTLQQKIEKLENDVKSLLEDYFYIKMNSQDSPYLTPLVKIEKIVKELEFVYPLVNKSLSDFFDLFKKMNKWPFEQVLGILNYGKNRLLFDKTINKDMSDYRDSKRLIRIPCDEIAELKGTKPEPEEISDNINGWIDLEGNFYKCEYEDHINLAQDLGFTESALEELGWIKLSAGVFYKTWYSTWKSTKKNHINIKQKNTMFDNVVKRKNKYLFINGLRVQLKDLYKEDI